MIKVSVKKRFRISATEHDLKLIVKGLMLLSDSTFVTNSDRDEALGMAKHMESYLKEGR